MITFALIIYHWMGIVLPQTTEMILYRCICFNTEDSRAFAIRYF